MSLVFISYRREDSAGFAGRLHESLERRLGEGEVFRDVDALQPGQDFVDAINARLLNCKACLVLIGREWLEAKDDAGRRRLEQDDDYVRLEIAAALARPGVLVIPVLVEGVSMPTSLVLPESIRALSRRQAVSLRDETWDTDVDRLASALRHEPRTVTAPPRVPSRRPLTWAALGLLVLVVAAILVASLFDRVAERQGTTTTTGTSQPGSDPRGSDTSAGARAYAIAIPRVSEVAYGDLIYTVLAGGVMPHGASNTLRLRVRFSNEGRYPANFWDASFRLAARGEVLSPTSGLNEIVDGHSVQQGIVSFDVPSGNTKVVLRVLNQNDAAEIPLDLASTGAPSVVDTRDTSDALSHAIAARLVRDAPLVTGKEIDLTLVSATARRFAKSLRIVAAVRLTNRGRYPTLFSTGLLRLVADGQPTAPIKGPSDAVDSRAPSTADFVFDVPPSSRRLILQVQGDSVTEMPLDVPSSLR
jgi:hypothetical protein